MPVAPAVPPQAITADERERLGRIAHEAWALWSDEQPKPWTLPETTWEDRHPATQESFRRIGEAVAAAEWERYAVVKDAADAYAQQNADVHRENLRLRDENTELRQQLAEAADAEREACAQLAESVGAFYADKPHGMPYAPFAGLLRKDPHA